MPYRVTKTYGHDRGLSCCFRQWRADSHCSQLHGYALAFEIVFEADELDQNNWVIDFGSLGWLKTYLDDMFDHTTIVGRDDPHLEALRGLVSLDVINLRLVNRVGCEAFAHQVFEFVEHKISERRELEWRGVRVVSVKVSEHGSNSATYLRGAA